MRGTEKGDKQARGLGGLTDCPKTREKWSNVCAQEYQVSLNVDQVDARGVDARAKEN